MSFPYSYISCPCTDTSGPKNAFEKAAWGKEQEEDSEEKTFDPSYRRTNFSLYPLDHLMWCEDCHDIKCARCTIEEIVGWYCPSCLFETPSSLVRTEGNRCGRNCFNCPICTAPMTVHTVDAENGPWILACEYCNWTSVDIGIIFEKPHGIHSQLTKIRQSTSRKALPQHTATAEGSTEIPPLLDLDAHFASLKSFYAAQLSKASSTNPILSPTSNINYDSPSSLARIMSLYTNPSSHKKNAGKPAVMQEATLTEGRGLISPASEVAVIQQLQSSGWSETANLAQRTTQDHSPRFLSQLLPVPTLLVTKRSRRCRACRHILVKPEPKPQSTRYKIKLVAINYIPNMTLKPLSLPSTPGSASATPASISSTPQPSAPGHDLSALPPSKPIQFLLHVQNPLFDAVKVTLATPTYTPGKPSSRVTILCPQFEVGANTDVWDEALGDGKSGRGTGPDSKRASKLPSGSKGAQAGGDSEGKVAEAGKVWERGRNWTSVVVEVVCARIPEEVDDEDADLLEIPVFVRLEYDADVAAEGGGKGLGETGEKKERREVSYWCVLGMGRISRVVI